MRVMFPVSVRLIMICLLVGPPALCKAGVLTSCCERGSHEVTSCADDSPCCDGYDWIADKGNDQGSPGQDSKHRSCGQCADVCAGPAKTCDEARVESPFQLILHFSDYLEFASSGSFFKYSRANPSQMPKLPFPASDVPLLI